MCGTSLNMGCGTGPLRTRSSRAKMQLFEIEKSRVTVSATVCSLSVANIGSGNYILTGYTCWFVCLFEW